MRRFLAGNTDDFAHLTPGITIDAACAAWEANS